MEELDIFIKKVTVECFADSEKQLGVNALALENFVDVCSVAVEFFCEPHHCSVLAAQLFLYNFSNVNVAHKALKGRNRIALTPALGTAKRLVLKISTPDSAPKRRSGSAVFHGTYCRVGIIGGFQTGN